MPVKYIRENGAYLGPHSVLAKVEMDYFLEALIMRLNLKYFRSINAKAFMYWKKLCCLKKK